MVGEIVIVRTYAPQDYPALAELYKQGNFYGGQFSNARDAEDRINRKSADDPHSLLVAERDGHILGTVSLIDDGRIAWLFRFAVSEGPDSGTVRLALYNKASEILRDRGHSEVLLYAPPERRFSDLYAALDFKEGGTYTCFWRSLEP